ncbi:MAG: S8 family serine peptidase [Verrucomicrobiales bacterium]|nr:S8 family serine peptidase [Verrucomicrobiales bacterium]
MLVPMPGAENEIGQMPGPGPGGVRRWAVANEVLVRLRPEAQVRRMASLAGVPGQLRWLAPRSVPRVGLAGGAERGRGVWESLATVTLPPGRPLEDWVAELARHPDVLYAEPNQRLTLAVEPGVKELPVPVAAPSDFEFARQWALNNAGQTGGKAGADIHALEAWARSTGSRDIVVAIVDTGVDVFHPDLEPNLWVNGAEIAGNGLDDDGNGYIDDVHGYDFVSDDGDPNDDNVHGTHVAGILGAVGNDENGIAGVSWQVGIMALKAFDETGGGSLDDTLSAIAYAVAARARVINASWGTDTRSRALDEAVADAVSRGIVFVAAAGNYGTDARFYPAAVPEAIAVGATDASDRSPTFSNHGAYVDLVAPGDLIHSTLPNAAWGPLSGTSMAAPHVSGLVALILSRQPSLAPAEVAAIVRSTADEVRTDRNTGSGRLNAARAISVEEPLPRAVLEVPTEWSGVLDLAGNAGGERFARYRLELGVGARPEGWESLVEATSLPAPGVLLRGFDTAAWDDGEYTLRLVVESVRGGERAIERRTVQIRNVRLVAPLANDVRRRGDRVEVRGTVAGGDRTFVVEWGLGRQPTAWRTEGIVLEAGGMGPRVQSLLANWDTRAVPEGAFVTLRVVARRGDRVVGEAWARMIHFESRLRDGWPHYLAFDDEFPLQNWREFNVADLDGDGRREVVLVDHGEPGGRVPRLKVLAADGSEVWSRDLPSGAPEYDAPVIGDLDGDGRPEVVIDTGSAGAIRVFRGDGTEWGAPWPVAPGGTHFGKLIADLDGDGRAEVVALANPPGDLVGNPERSLTVLDASGVVKARWRLSSCTVVTNAPELLAAVIQLDDDPELELVAPDGCAGISAFDLSQPARAVWTAATDTVLASSPVVGDLDGDGREEVLVAGVSRARGEPGGVHAYSREGSRRAGWPVLSGESFQTSPALGDVDGDGLLEVAVASAESLTLHLLSGSGFELKGWPTPAQVLAGTRSSPTLGDVDGDGFVDVVLPSPGFWLTVVLNGELGRAGGVRAWRADGVPIDFQPGSAADGLVMESAAGVSWHRFPAAVLTDLDGNGRLDVVASTVLDRAYSPVAPLAVAKQRSSMYAWELPVAMASNSVEWAMAQGGPARTGRYYRPPPPNRAPVLRLIPDQTIPAGGRFRALSLDRYADDADHSVTRLTWLIEGANL